MPSRREQIRMTDQEVRAFLSARTLMILVNTTEDGYPHPMPMGYLYDETDDCIYSSSFKKTQKITNFRKDPRATILVETGRVYSELKSVLIYADVELLEEPDYVFERMHKILTNNPEAQAPVSEEKLRAMAHKRIIMRFKPKEIISWDHTKLSGRY